MKRDRLAAATLRAHALAGQLREVARAKRKNHPANSDAMRFRQEFLITKRATSEFAEPTDAFGDSGAT
jgi:hypothetical protein